MSGLGVHFEEIEENVSSSEICDSINLALDAVLNWLQEAQGSQVNKLCLHKLSLNEPFNFGGINKTNIILLH